MSDISSDPVRICSCDSNGKRQCSNTCTVYICMSREAYPGEVFNVSAVTVEWDFGVTNGIAFARLFPSCEKWSVPTLNFEAESQLIYMQ